MRSVSRFAFYFSCSLAAFLLAATASATTMTYKWSDIDCGQSHIATWPGLKCETTNVVTTEGNIGAFRKWSTYGVTGEGYVHVFLWEAQNSFSYLTTDEITADFLKWVHVNGQFATQFSLVARYHDVDYTTFRDDKQQRACAGFRRTGNERRGGYDWIMGGILCAPPGKNLTQDQFFHFIDNVRLQGEPTPAGLRRAPGSF